MARKIIMMDIVPVGNVGNVRNEGNVGDVGNASLANSCTSAQYSDVRRPNIGMNRFNAETSDVKILNCSPNHKRTAAKNVLFSAVCFFRRVVATALVLMFVLQPIGAVLAQELPSAADDIATISVDVATGSIDVGDEGDGGIDGDVGIVGDEGNVGNDLRDARLSSGGSDVQKSDFLSSLETGIVASESIDNSDIIPVKIITIVNAPGEAGTVSLGNIGTLSLEIEHIGDDIVDVGNIGVESQKLQVESDDVGDDVGDGSVGNVGDEGDDVDVGMLERSNVGDDVGDVATVSVAAEHVILEESITPELKEKIREELKKELQKEIEERVRAEIEKEMENDGDVGNIEVESQKLQVESDDVGDDVGDGSVGNVRDEGDDVDVGMLERLNVGDVATVSAETINSAVENKKSMQEKSGFANGDCALLNASELYCSKLNKKDGIAARNLYKDIFSRKDDAEGDHEIYLTENGRTVAITQNDYDDINPVWGSGRDVAVWQGMRGGFWQVFAYDRKTGMTAQVTSGARNHINPATDGSHVVWQEWQEGGWEIYLAKPLTSGAGSEGGSDGAVYLIERITDNAVPDTNPKVSGGFIVWESRGKNSWQIFSYDISSGDISQLSSGKGQNKNPHIVIMWESEEDGVKQSVGMNMTTGRISQLGRIFDREEGDTSPLPIPELPLAHDKAMPTASASASVVLQQKSAPDDSPQADE